MINIPPPVLDDAKRFYARYLTKVPALDFNHSWLTSFIRTVECPFRLFPISLLARGLKARTLTVTSRGIPVRMRIIEPAARPRGMIVDIHGGGWTVGAAACDDHLVAPAAAQGYVVISIDYKLWPQSLFMGIIDECHAALHWILGDGVRQFELSNVFLYGDSSGAHLAMTSALRCRAAPGFCFLKGMVLFCGCYDLSGTESLRSAPPETLILNGPSLLSFIERVTGGMSERQRRDPGVSPLYADLRGLPPTLLIVGSADPMYDDNRLLAEALRRYDVAVELVEIPDAPHGFHHLPIKLAEFVSAYGRQWMIARTLNS